MFKSKVTNNPFADKVYAITKTMAFPSSKRIVEVVPELKAMKTAMDEANVGDSVSFYIGNTGMEDTVVYEKSSLRTWLVTRMRNKDGEVSVFGQRWKLQGMELMKSFADKHYRAFFDSKELFTEEYEIVYRKGGK